jgi:membrane fusion protein, heavy metal efflux system
MTINKIFHHIAIFLKYSGNNNSGIRLWKKNWMLGILINVLVLISCSGPTPAEQEASEAPHEEESNVVELTQAQFQTAGIVLGSIEQKQIGGTIKVNGHLDVPPQQLISISVPLGGFLKDTDLLQGSKVKKGQAIAVIENPEYIQLQQDYLEAKSQLEFAKADDERQRELARENINAQKTAQQANANYQVWLAKANALRAKLKLLNINMATLEQGDITGRINLYAPITGYVTQVNVNIGKYVNPTDVIFEIVDTDHLHAELIVFEKDIPKIKIGQKVRFTLANETRERMATVYLIGREISTERTIQIHCHLDQEDDQLLPGMYLKAVVEAGAIKVSALPDEAIVAFQERKYIFALSDEQEHGQNTADEHQHFVAIEVQTGNSELGYTEIAVPENVNEHTRIVVKGAYTVLSKMKNSEEEGHGH